MQRTLELGTTPKGPRSSIMDLAVADGMIEGKLANHFLLFVSVL